MMFTAILFFDRTPAGLSAAGGAAMPLEFGFLALRGLVVKVRGWGRLWREGGIGALRLVSLWRSWAGQPGRPGRDLLGGALLSPGLGGGEGELFFGCERPG